MLNALAAEIHADNVAAGWWDEFPVKTDRYETAVFLVVSELVEAGEGFRKNLPDDKLPHHPMFNVELADAAIRLLDLAGAYGVDVEQTGVRRQKYVNAFRLRRNDLERLMVIVRLSANTKGRDAIRNTITAVFALAEFHNIKLLPIISEKRQFNATRPDHQRAARAEKHGKKY